MTACTFDGTTVPVREVTRIDMLGDTSGSVRFECTLECRTKTFSEYTTLVGKSGLISKTLLYSGKTCVQTVGGTKGTLILNGVTYPNCYIENISAAQISKSLLNAWTFNISFVRDTSL